jgi:hypothetical protein
MSGIRTASCCERSSGKASSRRSPHWRADGAQPPLWYQLEVQDHSSSSSDVTPGNFPDLYPGGWRDLAQREAFALTKEFE